MEKAEKKGLGRAIRVIRTELGLSRRDLEGRTRLSYPYLSEIEAGKKTPSPVALQAISRALEVPEEELLDRARGIEHGRGAWSSPGHFHSPAVMADESPSEPSLKASMSTSYEVALESVSPIEELIYLARSLPPEDLQRLIDLARRLLR
jgi:transcriptional regulator with XRE-family HTH domain